MRSPSTRTNDPKGLRQRVLDVAAHAFQTKGYGGTSMHDLTRGARVSGGALHHHFPTKKDLALAVIRENVASAVMEAWIAVVQRAPTAADGILAAFETVIAELDATGAVKGCPLNNLALELSLADEDFRGAVDVEYRSWRSAIADCLRRDVERGAASFAADDPDAFADVVVSMYSGAIAIAKAEQRTTALRACAAQLQRIMSADAAG